MTKQVFGFLFLFLTVGLVSACGGGDGHYNSFKDNSWEEKQHYLPERMSVTGTASEYLPTEQVAIQFVMETLKDNVTDALNENSKYIAQAIKELKKLNLDEKEFSTSGLSVQPHHDQVYDKDTQRYNSIFRGYKVENRMRILTKNIHLAGSIVDAVVSSGIKTVEHVIFSASSASVKKLKDSLISKAVEDAQNQATLALKPLGYEILSVKSVNLSQSRNYYGKMASSMVMNDSFTEGAGSSDDTQLFSSNEKHTVTVDVSFLIQKTQTN